jgi:hypothetical protein
MNQLTWLGKIGDVERSNSKNQYDDYKTMDRFKHHGTKAAKEKVSLSFSFAFGFGFGFGFGFFFSFSCIVFWINACRVNRN